jgi:excisionase family DNA binding protein
LAETLTVTLHLDELESLVRRAVREEVARQSARDEIAQFTREQIAEAFGVSTKYILTMVQRDGLPAVRLGSEWRFPKVEVITWLKERSVQPGRHTQRTVKALALLGKGE